MLKQREFYFLFKSIHAAFKFIELTLTSVTQKQAKHVTFRYPFQHPFKNGQQAIRTRAMGFSQKRRTTRTASLKTTEKFCNLKNNVLLCIQ